MNIDQYRRAVTTVACPLCGARPHQGCRENVGRRDQLAVDYVHDDRSLAWHLRLDAAELRAMNAAGSGDDAKFDAALREAYALKPHRTMPQRPRATDPTDSAEYDANVTICGAS